jgi:DNA-binding CsgD family transcriptional regulator
LFLALVRKGEVLGLVRFLKRGGGGREERGPAGGANDIPPDVLKRRAEVLKIVYGAVRENNAKIDEVRSLLRELLEAVEELQRLVKDACPTRGGGSPVKLGDEELKAITMYVQGKTMTQIAGALGMSTSKVHELIRTACAKLLSVCYG